jgi:hypothetical protein
MGTHFFSRNFFLLWTKVKLSHVIQWIALSFGHNSIVDKFFMFKKRSAELSIGLVETFSSGRF